jgi:metal-dependent amidase/aminoacylase/carboxypeptidase family protein
LVFVIKHYCSVGHACGHNIITVQGLASALSIKTILEQNLAQGTVVLFGTPAEESTGGKINFINHGILKDTVDVALMLVSFVMIKKIL